MQPIFTIHAGEYLVGSKIEEIYGKKVNVWIPSKDTGIDLLLTDKETNSKTASIQVKFSKDFISQSKQTTLNEKLLACGWWTLNKEKLENSKADFWIFALHSFKVKEAQYVIVEKNRLLKIYESLGRNNNVIPTYIWITDKYLCWETRDLKNKFQIAISNGSYEDKHRNLTQFLNDWKSIEAKLGIDK